MTIRVMLTKAAARLATLSPLDGTMALQNSKGTARDTQRTSSDKEKGQIYPPAQILPLELQAGRLVV